MSALMGPDNLLLLALIDLHTLDFPIYPDKNQPKDA